MVVWQDKYSYLSEWFTFHSVSENGNGKNALYNCNICPNEAILNTHEFHGKFKKTCDDGSSKFNDILLYIRFQ